MTTVSIGVPGEIICRDTSEHILERSHTSVTTVSIGVPVVVIFRDISELIMKRSPKSVTSSMVQLHQTILYQCYTNVKAITTIYNILCQNLIIHDYANVNVIVVFKKKLRMQALNTSVE